MKEYGLIGYPLGHSFSKRFFTEKFFKEGIGAVYDNYELPDVGMLLDIVAKHPNLEGLNCTIPHKQAVMSLLDEISPDAKKIGAVNVIKIIREENSSPADEKGFKLVGYNSDIIGFTESIKPLLKPCHKKALVLGTGGAAKAITVALDNLGISWKYVSRSSAEDRFSYAQITPEVLQEYLVVINCSPVGMFPHTDEAPQLPYDAFTPEHLLYDLVYNPLETKFLKYGVQAGATTKNGLEMLELQALASWDIWTSK